MKKLITMVSLLVLLMVAVGCSSKAVMEDTPEEVQNVERG